MFYSKLCFLNDLTSLEDSASAFLQISKVCLVLSIPASWSSSALWESAPSLTVIWGIICLKWLLRLFLSNHFDLNINSALSGYCWSSAETTFMLWKGVIWSCQGVWVASQTAASWRIYKWGSSCFKKKECSVYSTACLDTIVRFSQNAKAANSFFCFFMYILFSRTHNCLELYKWK